jgi:hypothetical protein
MARSRRHQINALILALVAAHAMYWFVTGQDAGASNLMIALRVAQGIVGAAGALWFLIRSRGVTG